MDLFDKEEVTAPTIEAAVAEAIKPAAPKAEVKPAPAPVWRRVHKRHKRRR